MPSRSNRNAPRRRNNQHIYPETHDPHSEVDDSTLLSPVAGQPLLTPDSPQPTDYDLEADVERDGVRGLIEFDPDDGVVEGVGTLGLGGVDEAYPTSPSPLSLDPTSRSPVYSDEAPVAIQSGDEGDKGHTRSPVLSKEPTMLESFSRTFRNYVPSSIPVPSAGPTPPRVSRPVSFGSFLTASGAVTSMAPRRGTTTSGKRRDSGTHIHGSPPFEALFESDHEDDLVREGLTSYPSINTDDEIIWARWDSLSDGGMSRRILFVGYRAGFQIWDCTSLGSISEFLNLSDAQWGQVTFASVLPSPTASHADRFADDRPLVGIVSHLRGIPECIIYSLRRHRIVKKLSFPGLRTISPNADFIIVSTANPPTLHVISSSSFVTLFSIPSTTLVAFAHPSSTGLHTVSSPIDSSDTTSGSTSTPTSSLPEPVFALSHRLLAFVSTSPPPDSPTDTVVQPRTGTPSSDRGAQLFGVSQADLEHAAVKVGGTVLSGMKILGGMAYSAARSRMSGTSGRLGGSDAPPVVGAANMVFSKSAPAESGGDHERRNSMSTGTSNQDESSSKGLAGTSPSGVAPRNPSMKSSASTAFVTILDLRPLLSSRPPVIVSRFAALRDQPICRLQFSADGTSILAVPKDGRVAKIFQIRSNPNPSPSATRLDQVSSRSASERPRHHPQSGDNAPWHVYDLVRGRTSATVEDLDWAYDGRWIAIGTGNRTIHVFAVNPYGGRPDGRSHLNSRVYNTSELPLSMEVTPVVRLRSRRPTNPASVTPFVFLRPDTDIPLSLRPLSSHPSSPSSTSRASSPPRKSLSPVPRQQGSSSFQDVLVFDTDDGTLSLRRFVMDQVVGEHNLDSVPPGTTSTSFPGVSSIGRLSTPPSDRTSTLTVSGLSKMMEKPLDLVGRDSVVATWSLRRGRGWPDVRTVIKSREAFIAPVRPRKFDWLSQAELSTHSRSPRILPRSIYLSHQLSFHSLAEDYHALIRRYQLDVPTSKIEVRKQVAASAFPTGSGESFIYGTQSPSEARMISSSFDEPLASALSADIDYNSASPPVIPMLPNGTSGSRPKSFGNAIPIRSVTSGLSDGMTEGIGRIRREIGKVRSPRLLPRPDRGTTTASVPLEFEEVDEDFLNPVDDPMSHEDTSVSRSTSRGDSAPSVSTPSTTAVPLEDDDSWNRWDPEDKQIVDDAERFDDIVVGFMDEEQATMHESSSRRRRHFA
ncbi:hypothetical protein JAAARDRAFT_40559 [Jaapia argillacea MUCL 33604]|uniref:BCAS3 WD40 domain-containing protein n=1 Tax=Jaapia argillacea MUCL 33604 TaxID=933084 RepID=A0A067PNP1_9AGAM|nr:hypothetical protein JAAARDRAFT_40559 [Jaapia argillacea MUCL 33604]